MQGLSPPTNSVVRKGLAELIELQESLTDQPYSILLHLKLAAAYRSLGYPDLAAGDAYKALLLVDEILEEGEYHEQALEAAKLDIGSKADLNLALSRLNLTVPVLHAQDQDQDNDSEAIVCAKGIWPEIA